MSSEEENKNEVEDVAQEVEKATESIFNDGEYDEKKKGFIGLEGDGDIFWMIQSFFWGVIKSVSVLGIIFLLLWLVWGSSDESTETGNISQIVDSKKTKSKPISDKEKKLPIVKSESIKEKTGFMNMVNGVKDIFSSEKNSKKDLENPDTEDKKNIKTPLKEEKENIFLELKNLPINSKSVETVAFDLEKARVSYQENVFFQSVVWLKNAKSLGEISPKLLRITHPVKRAERIESALRQSDQLFRESRFLQRQLQREINELLIQGKKANETVGNIEEVISKSLQQFNPSQLNTLLNQKITIQKKAVEFLSKAKLRNTLLQNIQSFDALLRKKSVPLLRPATIVPAKNR